MTLNVCLACRLQQRHRTVAILLLSVLSCVSVAVAQALSAWFCSSPGLGWVDICERNNEGVGCGVVFFVLHTTNSKGKLRFSLHTIER